MTPLINIEQKAKHFSKRRAVLVQRVMILNAAIDQLKRKHLADIKESVNETSEALAELNSLLEKSPNLFVKPRTIVFHGIKVGFQKQKGKIEIKDEAKTILLIRKQLPEQADLLISTKESVSKDALANVAVAELKRIGCNVIADTDVVVIKPTDSEVDKLVTALLKEVTEEVTN